YPITYNDYVSGVYMGTPYTHWFDFYEITMTQAPGGPGGLAIGPGGLQASEEAANSFLPTALQLTGHVGPGGAQCAYFCPGLPVVPIGLDRLKQPAPGGPSGIVRSTDAKVVIYPVMQRGRFVTSISTRLNEQNKWIAAVSNPVWTETLVKVRD